MVNSRGIARPEFASWATAPSFVPHGPAQVVVVVQPTVSVLPPRHTGDSETGQHHRGLNTTNGQSSQDNSPVASNEDQLSSQEGSPSIRRDSPRAWHEASEGCRVCSEWTNPDEVPVLHNLPSEWFGNACSGLQQHLDHVPHTRWYSTEEIGNDKPGWKHDSLNCDRTYRIDDRAMNSYRLTGIANLNSDVERELEIVKQILVDVNLQVRMFYHRWSATKTGQKYSLEKFAQTQAYHGPSSKDDVVEPWQIHVPGETAWYRTQSRILGHQLLSIAFRTKVKSELLKKLRYLRGLHQFGGSHGPEVSRRVSHELNSVLEKFLRDQLKGFLPLTHLCLRWGEKGHVEVVEWEVMKDWSFAADQNYAVGFTHLENKVE